MAGSALQIDDEYCKNMGKYFIDESAELEKFISEYIAILERIKSNAVMKGNVADALKVYISYGKKLKGQIESVSETAKEQIERFLSAIDEADQYLF